MNFFMSLDKTSSAYGEIRGCFLVETSPLFLFYKIS
jgi:hypothetical protein